MTVSLACRRRVRQGCGPARGRRADQDVAERPAVRNPRRAYKADGSVIAPMDLANMRENGIRSVEEKCDACRREAVVNCDELPDAALVS